MRVSSRLALSAAIACGGALAAASPAVAQENDGVVDGVLCNSVEALADPLVGCVDNAGNQRPQAPGNSGNTPPAGAQAADEPDDSSSSVRPVDTSDDSDDSSGSDDSSSAPSSTGGPSSGGSDSGPIDRDNGTAPKGGVETGTGGMVEPTVATVALAGGMADQSGADTAALAGGFLIVGSGIVLARRRHARHALTARHAR